MILFELNPRPPSRMAEAIVMTKTENATLAVFPLAPPNRLILLATSFIWL